MTILASRTLFLIFASCLPMMAFAQLQAGPLYQGNGLFDLVGTEVCGVGDVNADGFADVAIGIYRDDFAGPDAGAVEVYSGFDGLLLTKLYGGGAGDFFGYSVAAAGDINNDGFADVVVGAYADDTSNGTDSGSATVYSGADWSVLTAEIGTAAYDEFGYDVAGVGDINGDGFDDWAVGARKNDTMATNGGQVRVYSGMTGGVLHTFNGTVLGDQLGLSLAGAGDVDGDGASDIVVAAPVADVTGTDSGRVLVYSGADGSVLHDLSGDAGGDSFGFSVAGAGDVDQDGYADFIAGAYRDDDNGMDCGTATLFSGFDGSVLYKKIGLAAGDQFGRYVGGGGDVDGDGVPDFIIGAHNNDNAAPDAGSVRVFSGATGAIIQTLDGAVAADNLGFSVAIAGDLDANGRADVIVGAPGDDALVFNGGCAKVYFADTSPVHPYTVPFAITTLDLSWQPDNGDIQSLTGTISCSGATPGASGLTGVSLAPTNFLYFGFTLLIDVTPASLLSSDAFGFDIIGSVSIPNISRQNPFLAGIDVHIQFYETSPIIGASNGLAMRVAP